MLNPFTATGYDLIALTAAIQKLPNLYGRINDLGLFPFDGIATTSVGVEQINGALNIVRSRPRGAAPDKVIADKRALRTFAVPHLNVEDVLLPEDFQNVRAFGSETGAETMANIMARKLQKMKNILDQTLEYLRMGALKGIILDADGSTLYNLYTEFSISPQTVDFALDDDETDVLAKCLSVKRHVETNLKGERMSGIRVLVDGTFYDALVAHPSVEKAFASYMALNQDLASDYRRGFRFGGLVFEEYPAVWTDHDGVSRLAIASGEGHCFPEGTSQTFRTVVAPGNFLETANTIGQPYYAKQEEKKYGQGVDVYAESNVLPICLRPEVLVKVTA